MRQLMHLAVVLDLCTLLLHCIVAYSCVLLLYDVDHAHEIFLLFALSLVEISVNQVWQYGKIYCSWHSATYYVILFVSIQIQLF